MFKISRTDLYPEVLPMPNGPLSRSFFHQLAFPIACSFYYHLIKQFHETNPASFKEFSIDLSVQNCMVGFSNARKVFTINFSFDPARRVLNSIETLVIFGTISIIFGRSRRTGERSPSILER